MAPTKTLERVVSHLPATTPELADELDYKSYSGVYDAVSRLREHGYVIDQNEDNEYFLHSKPGGKVAADGGSVKTRVSSGTKQSITNSAKSHLIELERELTDRANELSLPANSGLNRNQEIEPGNESMVFFRSDDHFGQVETNQNGKEIFNSDIAENYVRRYFNRGLSIKHKRQEMGTTFDGAYLILDGDHVTNETIYEGQPHNIDESLDEQVDRAARIYVESISRLAAAFPQVTVITQHGNHGELRMGGQSSGANADDLMFLMVNIAIEQSDIDNVTFIQNEDTNSTAFNLRNHRGYIRHGQDSLEHIGTSSGKDRWKTWFIDAMDSSPDNKPWDIAYRGHYHEVKIEPIAGRPVVMGGALEPSGDYANSLGIAKSRPAGIVHGATDKEPLAWSEFVYFN